MYDYVVSELPALVESKFPVIPGRRSVSGHSMGGHGALVVALRNPGGYRSVSAFSPICHPIECPWGTKALGGYLGDDRKTWEAYDATCLVRDGAPALPTLVDQGTDDEFLQEQLNPWALQAACADRGYPVTFRMQDGYDHSYHFIASFIGEHLAFHQSHLQAS
jgi:S-formylglutathione hydrolase